MIKFTIKYLIRRFGYDLVRSDLLEQNVFARHLSGLFKALNVQCILDVGANVGDYRAFLREIVGYDGLIISFEPVEKNFNCLCEMAKSDSRWKIYRFALGSQNTEMKINVMRSSVFSSFLDPDHSLVSEFKESNQVEYTETVEVKRLDSIMEMLNVRYPMNNIYLKMDTQGYDMEVVKGAGESLTSFAALQTEVSLKKIYKNMPDFTEMRQILGKSGFEITGLFPVSRDSLHRVIEFDCIMVNSKPSKFF